MIKKSHPVIVQMLQADVRDDLPISEIRPHLQVPPLNKFGLHRPVTAKRTLGRVPIEPSLDASFANVDVPRLAYLPYNSSEVPKVDFVPHTSRSRPP